MRKHTFASRALRWASLLTLATVIAACGSPTAPRFPEDEEDPPKDDPKEGMVAPGYTVRR